MKRTRIIGLALVAAFALSAVAAASALAAEPEFKPETGGFPVNFSSSSTTNETKLEVEGGNTVKCKGLSSSGKLESARKAGEVVVHFTNCKVKVSIFEATCTTKGASSGEIVTEKLVAKPVYLVGKKGAGEERGLDVSPATAGGKFAEFECSGTTIVVKNGTAAEDSLIGRIAAAEVGVQEHEVTIKFKQTSGKQEPKEYENEKGEKFGDFLESEGIGGSGAFARKPSAEEATEKIVFEGTRKVELS
jgi:hypothetical protein